MPHIKDIKTRFRKGESISKIARDLNLDRKTVRKYVQQTDFSPSPPVKQKRPSKLDAFEDIICGWLEEDKKVWRKQRHSAQRIFERLRDEHGFDGSYEIVQRKVKLLREETMLKKETASEGFLPLEWSAGTAQVDFGDADVLVNGETERWHMLSLSFPYSNVGYAQVFCGETAECVCQGLKDIFTHIGGVPDTIIFDNATGIGRRVMGEVHLSTLFQQFELHYGFSSKFCNPYSGHEKGNVERKVFTQRSHLFVPVPEVNDVMLFNKTLMERSFQLSDQPHYRKEKSQTELFREDLKSLTPLPAGAFNACRYESRKTNKYGHIVLDGCHFYSTRPDLPRTEVMVEIGAHMIQVLDTNGDVICAHRRMFGKKRTESIDQTSTLTLLAQRPGAWEQCGVRDLLPPVLTEYIDAATGAQRRDSLKLLAELNAEYGFKTAVAAMSTAMRNNQLQYDDAMVLGARMAGGDYLLTTAASGSSLDAYDALYNVKGSSHPC